MMEAQKKEDLKNAAIAILNDDSEAQEFSIISPDLLNQYESVKTFTDIHELLIAGCFQYDNHARVKKSLIFIQALHRELLDTALKHVDANKIPELQNLLK